MVSSSSAIASGVSPDIHTALTRTAIPLGPATTVLLFGELLHPAGELRLEHILNFFSA